MLRLNVTLGAASARNRERLLEGLQYQVPSTRLEPGRTYRSETAYGFALR